MTFNELKAYFEVYARSHVELQHTDEKPCFTAVHADASADEAIKLLKKPLIMVLCTYDKKMFPPKGENYDWDKNICFFILEKRARKTEAEIVACQSRCEVIVDDFCTRLIDDRFTKITGFVQESFVMQPVGPMSDDYYGQVAMFNIVDEFNSQVNPERWM